MRATSPPSPRPWSSTLELDHGHAEQDVLGAQDELGRLREQLTERIETVRVNGRSAADLPRPDHEHLGDAGFDRGPEVRVWLHPTDQHDRVGFRRMPIAVDGHAVVESAELDDIHAGPDRAAHALLVDAEARQDLDLAFGGCRTVAAHRREDEELGAHRLELIDDRPDAFGDVGDASRPAVDRDRHAGCDPLADRGVAKLGGHRAGDVVDGRRRELLPDSDHARHVDVETAGDLRRGSTQSAEPRTVGRPPPGG